MRCHPVFQCIVHARLPATSGRFEGLDHIGIEENGQQLLGSCQARPATVHGLVTQVLVGALEKLVAEFWRTVRRRRGGGGVFFCVLRSLAFLMLMMRRASPHGAQTMATIRQSNRPTVTKRAAAMS